MILIYRESVRETIM